MNAPVCTADSLHLEGHDQNAPSRDMERMPQPATCPDLIGYLAIGPRHGGQVACVDDRFPSMLHQLPTMRSAASMHTSSAVG